MAARLIHTLYSLGCAIEDGTAFGKPYFIAASPIPRIEGSDLVFTATYGSLCNGGGSEFEVRCFGEEAHEGAPEILQQSVMLVVYRHEPSCASPYPFESEVTLEIIVPLPTSARNLGTNRMLACPPGSTYDMVKLGAAAAPAAAATAAAAAACTTSTAWSTQCRAKTAPPIMRPEVRTKPADWDEVEDGPCEAEVGQIEMQRGKYEQRLQAEIPLPPNGEDGEAATDEEEGARVARELATHTAADSVAFLAHCEQMLAQEQAWSCCSQRMISELRKKVASDQAAEAEHNLSGLPASAAAVAAAAAEKAGLQMPRIESLGLATPPSLS